MSQLLILLKMENMYLRIKELCKLKGMTLSDVAQKAGIARETLSRQVSGNPTLKTLTEVAKALDVPVHQLFVDSARITGSVRIGDQLYMIDSVQDIEQVIEKIKNSSES